MSTIKAKNIKQTVISGTTIKNIDVYGEVFEKEGKVTQLTFNKEDVIVDDYYRKWVDGTDKKYSVDRDGNVLAHKFDNIKTLSISIDKDGYPRVSVIKNKKMKYYTLHRLLMETFIDNPYNKETVNHINGIKTDNRLENLEWNTYAENMQHAFKTKLKVAHSWTEEDKKNAFSKTSKLSLNEADDILEMKYNYNLSNSELVEITKLSYSTIKKLVDGKTQYFRKELAL